MTKEKENPIVEMIAKIEELKSYQENFNLSVGLKSQQQNKDEEDFEFGGM